VQYSANEYVDDLKAAGFHISMAKKGNTYNNAQVESFIKTQKSEGVYLLD
jgi:transposase InsO family protein